MAEVLRYVDVDVIGGAGNGQGGFENAYSSLNQWEAAEAADLDGAGNTHRVLNQASSGGNDTTVLVINGWTTSAGSYITIEGDDFPSDGVWDDTTSILDGNDAQHTIEIKDNHVRLVNMQLLCTVTPDNAYNCVILANIAAGSAFYIDSCILKGVCSGGGAANGVTFSDADATCYIFNTQVYGFLSTGGDAGDTGFKGISIGGGVCNVYSCTIYDNRYGIRRSAGTVTAIGNAIFDNTDDIDGTITTNYNAMDEGAGEGVNTLDISGTWDTTCFTDPEADPPDFSVQDDQSPIYLASEITYDDDNNVPQIDIIDTARNTGVGEQTSIGAYELTVVGGDAGIMTTNTGFWGATF